MDGSALMLPIPGASAEADYTYAPFRANAPNPGDNLRRIVGMESVTDFDGILTDYQFAAVEEVHRALGVPPVKAGRTDYYETLGPEHVLSAWPSQAPDDKPAVKYVDARTKRTNTLSTAQVTLRSSHVLIVGTIPAVLAARIEYQSDPTEVATIKLAVRQLIAYHHRHESGETIRKPDIRRMLRRVRARYGLRADSLQVAR